MIFPISTAKISVGYSFDAFNCSIISAQGVPKIYYETMKIYQKMPVEFWMSLE